MPAPAKDINETRPPSGQGQEGEREVPVRLVRPRVARRVERPVTPTAAGAASDQVEPLVAPVVAPPVISSVPIRRLLEEAGPSGPSLLVPRPGSIHSADDRPKLEERQALQEVAPVTE